MTLRSRSSVRCSLRLWLSLGLAVISVVRTTLLDAAEAHKTPNILFCIADDWGAHASAYGTPWVKTPNFDRVAREGLLFRHAYTPNAKCAPSRACLLTGRNPWQLKEAANHICYFPTEFKGWGEVLAEHGWTVGNTQKVWGPGVAKDAEGRPRQMCGQAFNARHAPPPAKEISNNDYAANFVDFLDQAPPFQPWCFWFGAIEPHRGYEFGAGVKKGGKQLSDIDRVPACWPDDEQVRHDMLDYAFEVEHFDRHVGRMLAELERRGQLENTLVIVTSDHGMPFPRGKGNTGDMANHVPLALMWQGVVGQPGRVVEEFVSFVDLAPTIVQAAGLKWEQTGMAPTCGHSWQDLIAGGRQTAVRHRDHVLVGRERNDVGRPHDWGYPTRAWIENDWVLVENFEPTRWPGGNPETGYLDCDAGVVKSVLLAARRQDVQNPHWALCFGKRPALELYDTRTDPDCIHNLAAEPRQLQTLEYLRKKLRAELTAQGDPRMTGGGAEFDAYIHANAGHVGFYERFLRGEKIKAGWINPSDIEPAPLD